MKVIKSDKVPPLFHLLLMNNPYADAIVRDVQELVELQSVDPIRAAGGCYCRECKYRGDPEECPLLYFGERELDEHDTSNTDFCSYGEPKEAQDNA